jgi:archaeal flagellar protein FlaJ
MPQTPSPRTTEGGKAPQPYVSTPLRTKKQIDTTGLDTFFSGIATGFPDLKKTLTMAEMPDTPTQFVENAALSAFGVTLMLEFCLFMAFMGMNTDVLTILIGMIVGLVAFGWITFNFMLMKPKIRTAKRGKKIDQDLLFAGRHMLIELRSGITLFDAMLGVSQDYGEVSREFNKIVEKITLGVPANIALHDVAENTPSQYLRRVVLQISNSLVSGSDLAGSLEVVLDQISKEQIIQVKAYGQKLNPIVMFFMLFGVIIPSLGVAFLILLLSIVGSSFSTAGPTMLVGIFGIVTIVQYMFLSVVESSRPSFEMM